MFIIYDPIDYNYLEIFSIFIETNIKMNLKKLKKICLKKLSNLMGKMIAKIKHKKSFL